MSNLDQTLDDLISSQKKTKGGRGAGRGAAGRGRGAGRQLAGVQIKKTIVKRPGGRAPVNQV